MVTRRKSRIPKNPHSIEAAARALDTDVDFLLDWLNEGRIRACINYRDYAETEPSYSIVYTSADIDLKELCEKFSGFTATKEKPHSDNNCYYPANSDTDRCALTNLFSTMHSTISIRECQLQDEKNTAVILADLKGLWQIECLDAVQEILKNPNSYNLLIHIVPYIPEGLYHLQIDKQKGGYQSGFIVQASLDEVRISYDDIKRIEEYLYGKNELEVLDNSKILKLPLSPTSPFTPTEQSSMAFVQLIESNPNFGNGFIKQSDTTLKKIEGKLRDERKKGDTIIQIKLNPSTFRKAISNGKKLLNNPLPSKNITYKNLSRKPYINVCKTLIQLIDMHPLIKPEVIEEPDKVYAAINKMLSDKGMDKFKMTKDIFKYVFEITK